MAAPSWAIVGTRLSTADALTGWDAGNISADDAPVQGTAAIGQKISAALGGMGYTHGSTFDVSGTNRRCAYIWMNALSKLETEANGGLRMRVGNDASNYHVWYVAGSDNYTGGWRKRVVSPRVTPTATVGTPNLASVDYVAGFFNVLASIMGNFNNTLVDAVDLLEAIRMTAGDATTPGTFSRFQVFDTGTTANQYGVIRSEGGVFFIQGRLYVGDGATTTLFDDRSGAVVVFEDTQVDTDFYEIQLTANATLQLGELSGGAAINGATILSSGEAWHLNLGAGTANLYGCTFGQTRISTLTSAVAARSCTWVEGGVITAAGADLRDSVITNPTVAADGSAINWNVATDTSGLLDNMLIQKGANAHHAIELGTSSPTSVTLKGIDFIGFNASNGQNDSTIYVRRTSGTVTINLSGNSGNVSYKSDGATVVLEASVSVTFTGLAEGSEVRVYSGTMDNAAAATEIAGVESSGTSFSWSHSNPGGNAYYVIHKEDYETINQAYVLPSSDTSFPISQRTDRNYSNP